MKKTLTFEGVGCVPVNDVENCRIRTAFINNQGKAIYLEIIAGYKGNIYVDFCHYITGEHDDKTANDGGEFCGEYTKANILAFVNRYCHCSFTDIEVTNEFDDYRIHGEKAYNLMEAFPIDYELRAKRAAAFAAVDAEYKAVCHSKYSVISHSFPDANTIEFKCYATAEALGNYPRKVVVTL